MPIPQQVLARLESRDVVNKFCDDLEQHPFDKDGLRDVYPRLMDRWKLIGKTQSVAWDWAMMTKLSVVSFLYPTAVLKPLESTHIYGVVWNFLLHLGTHEHQT